MPDRATERPEAPSLRHRKGNELRLSGPALVDLMRAVLDRGRSFRFCARGWSMSPFIKDGDVITVAPVRTSNSNPNVPTGSPRRAGNVRTCGIGQVVAFVSPGSRRLVVHRIIGRHESRSIIQGDSLSGSAADAVHPDDILGRVVRVERGKKRVRLGLGPERYAIAIFSRAGLLLPVVVRAAVLTRFLRKRPNEDN